ncbi:ABC transporter related [Parvibaculum lavamentivorans DS-1]|uniref:ABC transporter related n=1 Tax=Parvibaculum lavamentivorans (strain DS-1 / DSM 13023 / NCIMB 13966) TaxID=402881 RepID=A7HRC5_PARL1|nr:ABC transporter ATP-binding protein [Parvibaculum lavamentivorans]ABS62458.1 ABC transporter related [Parvibaculum lavamentivorans DS-1]
MDKGLRVSLRQETPFPLDVSFDVAPGEAMALVGPSGSGKTTTLRAIAGFHTGATGNIACNGATWLDSEEKINMRPRERRAGLVFQSYALFPHLTARQNVMEALGDLPKEARHEAAAGYLARVHLDTHADRRPAELSGGEQQRVAVARALARRPDVLLLDEPFSAVDRVTRRSLRRELAELRRDLPMPVVLVTHDLDDVRRLAERICVMHRGKILQAGSVKEVMAHPASEAVAELLDLAADD